MDKATKEQLKKAIEKKIDETQQLLTDLKEDTRPMGLDSAVGRLSRMDYINNKSVSEAGIRKAEESMKGLQRWLSLYDTDKFGKCTRCGNEININRLLLMPQSTRCVHCVGR